jgi:hypothetical protein
MEKPEVPLEQAQEEITHHAHAATEPWIMGVALTAAILAALAAVTALLAEHHANEAMLEQIEMSDQWNYYQAKGIKAGVLDTKIKVLEALGKSADEQDREKLREYKEEDQKEIRKEAEALQASAKAHMGHHTPLSLGVTMFQVAIAIGAVSVLTKQRPFWFVCMAFGVIGMAFLIWGVAL